MVCDPCLVSWCVCVFTAGNNMGRAILGGSALFGVGSLCFYGLGLSNEAGAIDRARYIHMLPLHVWLLFRAEQREN